MGFLGWADWLVCWLCNITTLPLLAQQADGQRLLEQMYFCFCTFWIEYDWTWGIGALQWRVQTKMVQPMIVQNPSLLCSEVQLGVAGTQWKAALHPFIRIHIGPEFKIRFWKGKQNGRMPPSVLLSSKESVWQQNYSEDKLESRQPKSQNSFPHFRGLARKDGQKQWSWVGGGDCQL